MKRIQRILIPVLGLVGLALTLTAAQAQATLVDILIRPEGDPNTVNPGARGVIPVAILGSDTFHVADVDVTTLAFSWKALQLTSRSLCVLNIRPR